MSPAAPDHGAERSVVRSRIATRFAALKAEGRGALMPFLMAYDPDRATSLEMLRGLPAAGADLIEIGMPFSDPMADGPTVQLAGQRALKAGGSTAGVLAMLREFRAGDDTTPVILMGYLNPVLSYGAERFCIDAAAAGADGVIMVDMPPEESQELAPHAAAAGLDLIRLIAPTTNDARLPGVLRACSGFIYYVAITGITGTRSASAADLALNIPRLRRFTDLPIAIGFGVRSPEQAAEAARVADGAVVASALIETMAATLSASGAAGSGTAEAMLAHVRRLASAVRAS